MAVLVDSCVILINRVVHQEQGINMKLIMVGREDKHKPIILISIHLSRYKLGINPFKATLTLIRFYFYTINNVKLLTSPRPIPSPMSNHQILKKGKGDFGIWAAT